MSDTPVVVLYHGTTRRRAEAIIANGPNPFYVEPLADRYSVLREFSCTESVGGPVQALGRSEAYARLKDRNYPDEGGPVLLQLEVPADIVDIARGDELSAFIRDSGAIAFAPGYGYEELLAAWPTIDKRILPL